MQIKYDFELSQIVARHLIAKAQIEFGNYLVHYLEIANILYDSYDTMLMFEANNIYRFVAKNRIKDQFIYN